MSSELRFNNADPYLKWLVKAIEGKLPDNWNDKEQYLKAALNNAKAYLKENEK
jgi:hypothetical protein